MPMSDVREFTLLLEKSKGLLGRLEWLYKNTKDIMVWYCTVNILMADRSGSGDANFAKKGLQADDNVAYAIMREQRKYKPYLSKEDRAKMLKDFAENTLATGEWGLNWGGEGLPERHRAEKLIPWIAKQAKEDDPNKSGNLWYRDSRNLIYDWWEATRPDMSQITAREAYIRAAEWHQQLELNSGLDADKNPTDVSGLTLLASLDKGVEIFELPPEALKMEGAAMRHCIGKSPSYAEEIRGGRARAWSIRQNRKRVFTVFLIGHNVSQFKGKANRTFENCKPEEQEVALIAGKWAWARGGVDLRRSPDSLPIHRMVYEYDWLDP